MILLVFIRLRFYLLKTKNQNKQETSYLPRLMNDRNVILLGLQTEIKYKNQPVPLKLIVLF